MMYREMEVAPPAKPPRREWWLAMALRHADGSMDWGAVAIAIAAAILALVILLAVSDAVVPFSRGTALRPATLPADVRCLRSGGTWNAGQIDGLRAEWCAWGQR